MEQSKKPILVLIEGMDTSGKSIQSQLLHERLTKEGIKSQVVHFPDYDSPIGAFIKQSLNSDKGTDLFDIPGDAFQMLYVADQTSFQPKLTKLLEENDVVILDRYMMSTLVYGMSSGIPFEVMRGWQNRLRLPDITFILDLPAEEVARRKDKLDKFESNKEFLERVRMFYVGLGGLFDELEKNPIRFRKISALDTPDMIFEIIYKEVMKLWET